MPRGRPALERAHAPGDVEETVTRRIRHGGDIADPIAGKFREFIGDVGRMTVEGYVAKLSSLAEDIGPMTVDVFKRLKSTTNMSKVGALNPSEIEPDRLESLILETWGTGLYQLRPVYERRYYSPGSTYFRVGGETAADDANNALTRAVPSSTEDVNAAIIEATKQVGNVAALAALKKAVKEEEKSKGDDEMNMVAVQAMIAASTAPLIEMMKAAEARAQRAEERNDRLMEKMLDARSAQAGANAPVLAEVMKAALTKPETLSLLLGGNEPAPNEWISLLKDVAQGLAPLAQQLLGQIGQQIVARGVYPTAEAASARAAGPPAIAAGGRAPVSDPHEPRPTGAPPATASGEGNGGPMPMQLNEEQEMAKENLVAFIKANDFGNAMSALESFPGFVPAPNGGATPLGEFLISQIDPAANPRVYLPQLYMLMPEVKQMVNESLAFIKYVQDKLVADDDARARAEGGAHGSH